MRSEQPEPMLNDPYLRDLARAYLLAKSYVVGRGFEEELAWQEASCMNTVSEDVFLREASWVVLSAGMREAVVRTVFTDPWRVDRPILDRHAQGMSRLGRRLRNADATHELEHWRRLFETGGG